MSKFNIEAEDIRYPVEVEFNQYRPVVSWNGEKTTNKYPPLEIQMTFRIRDGLMPVEGVALMYYQFDKFMKEHYGSTVNAYQEQQRKRRID